MFVVRMLAGLFLVLAAIAFVSDLTRSLNGSHLVLSSFATHWKGVSPQSLAAFQQGISRGIHPLLWDPVIWRVLLLPTSFLFATIGGTLAYLCRRQRRVNIFIN